MLYLLTANGVQGFDQDDAHAWRHYEYLVEGFLNGHLYLSHDPDPEMLALPDPYDPAANTKYRMWDASLYKGHYYLYFGPTPAVLLMLPWKAITGVHLPQRIATGIFATAGLAALTLLLTAIRRRHFPTSTPLHLFWAVVLVGHATWIPVLVRRPAVWELPTITAAAFLWWSIYCLWRFHDGGRKARWAVAAGVALAFALGGRPTYLFGATAVLLLFGLPIERGLPWTRYIVRLLPGMVPFAVGIGCLLVYNYERFGSVFEFGQHYQLWGADERNVVHFSVANIPFNVWLYFLSVPQFSPYFPFVRGVSLSSLPQGYLGIEEMQGILVAVPALLLGVVAWRRYGKPQAKGQNGSAIQAVLIAGTVTSLLASAVLCCFSGGCSRYLVELVAGWAMVAGVGFLAVFENTAAFRFGRVIATGAVAWSIAFVWLASFSFRDFAQTETPAAYRAFAHTLDYPSYWLARAQHRKFGPIQVKIRLSPTELTGSTVLVADGRASEVAQLEMDRFDARHVMLRLRIDHILVVETPPLVVPDEFTIQVDAPWLYPPKEHPYWDDFPNTAERKARQLLFAITLNGMQYRRLSIWTFDSARFAPVVQSSASASQACAWVENWERVPVVPEPADAPAPKIR